ncbi:hypothetical protein ACFWUP_20795 [Nocardia sp. NPDC058658]|uniref:hypothetical protein n=1 Tax=Nocardia sp. NPDC058658 TaxID=3346580 RepID=UPI0036668E00
MTTDGAASGLMTEASSGRLYYEVGTAAQCAQACARFVAIFDAILARMTVVQYVNWINDLTCGRALSSQFNLAGDDLEKRIREHQQAVTDLGETFVQAERRYVSSDESAATEFARLRNAALSGADGSKVTMTERVVNAPKVVEKDTRGREVPSSRPQKPEPSQELKDLANKQGQRYPSIAAPTTGSSLTWDDLHRNRYVISGSVSSVQQAASAWGTFSDTLDGGLSTFSNELQRTTSTGMDSPAGARAQAAIFGYAASAKQLVGAMDLMSDNLALVHGSMAGLYPGLPVQSEKTYRAKHQNDERAFTQQLNNYRTTWDNWYPENAETASNSIPLMPSVASPVATAPADLPAIEQPGAGLGNGGGSSAGAGGGGGDNSGAPVTQPTETPAETPTTPETPTTETPTTQTPTTQTPSTTTDDSASDDQTSDTTPSTSPTESTSPTTAGTDTSDSSSPSTTPTTSTPSTSPTATSPVSALASSPSSSKPGSTSPGGGGGARGGGGAAGAAVPSLRAGAPSNLFPRAGLAGSVSPTAGAVSASSGAGMPGAMGPAGAGAGQGNRQDSHQRAKYLDSATHLDDGLGEAQVVVNPVIGEDPEAFQEPDAPTTTAAGR